MLLKKCVFYLRYSKRRNLNVYFIRAMFILSIA